MALKTLEAVEDDESEHSKKSRYNKSVGKESSDEESGGDSHSKEEED